MSICELRIHNLRCFSDKVFSFSPHLNFITAPNGAGKTSILEAFYILSCGHSFRTREINPLIRRNETEMTLFSRFENEDSISIQKSSDQPTRIKINHTQCTKTSDLAQYLPCQIYYQDLFALMDGAPSLRRTMMDWGLFHVKQSYHIQLKLYYQTLKQRNALLRQKKSRLSFEPWDQQLNELADTIHTYRKEYMRDLQPKVQEYLRDLSATECSLHYDKGWDRKKQSISLYEQLQKDYEKDLNKGYTSSGIHQADIIFADCQTPAKKTFSRGQQKITLIAVKLAQTELIKKPCLHLLDDIFSELDTPHIQRLLEKISSMDEQFILTLLPTGQDSLKYIKNPNIITI